MNRILILLLLVAPVTLFSQVPFKVITVNGEIVATKANISLENGIEVYSDENFDFIRPNSRAAMINSDRGRVILTEQNASDVFSRAAFAPAMSTVSARSGAIGSLAELQGIFSDKILIIDDIDIQVGRDYFPMGEEKFFFIRYTYNEETINKKLPFSDDILSINKDVLYMVDGKPIDGPDSEQLSLFYHKSAEDQPESVLISSFEPIFVSGEQIKPEIQIIVNEFEKQPAETILAEVYDYLNSFYGKVDRNHLEKWLKSQFNLDI